MNKLVLTAALLLFATFSYAQPGSGGPAPAPAPTPNNVPLDGGSSMLLASGVAYGLRKLKQRRDQRKAS